MRPFDTTVVTAWYRLNSKYPQQTYLEWIRKFCQIPCALVVFSNAESVEDVKRCRGKEYPTTYVIREVPEFHTSQYDEYWNYSEQIDIERLQGSSHSVLLYKIWAEKAFWCAEVAQTNPYGSKYFCWADIGAVRNDDMFPRIFSFPTALPKYFADQNDSRVLLSCVKPFEPTDLQMHPTNGVSMLFQNIPHPFTKLSCPSVIRIQGGFFAGTHDSIQWYAKAYDQEIQKWQQAGLFAGKDQYLMANLLFTYKDKRFIVLPPDQQSYGNEWFSFLVRMAAVPIVTTFIQGGLGNQMFQVALALAVSYRDHAFAAFPRIKPEGAHMITNRGEYWTTVFQKVFSVPTHTYPFESFRTLDERWDHSLTPIPSVQSNVMYKGYFQSSKYFFGLEEQIKAVLRWKEWKTKPNVLGIHVRRGDYVKLGWTLPVEYYLESCKTVLTPTVSTIEVYSDDKEWCTTVLLPALQSIISGDVKITSCAHDYEELYELSGCEAIVMSNSSFSWWAAFLSKANHIVAPNPWFKTQSYCSDIYEQAWIQTKW
jgi:hypothetical protein